MIILKVLVITDSPFHEWIANNLKKETINFIESTSNYCVVKTDYVSFYLYHDVHPVMSGASYDKAVIEKKIHDEIMYGIVHPITRNNVLLRI